MEPERKPKRGERGAASDEFFPAAPHERQCSLPRELWDVLESGFGARTEPLLLGISTAGDDRASLLGDVVREGEEGKDRRFLYRWIGASRDSEADYRDPKTRREPVAGRVRLDPPDPSTARHAPQCEFAAETDPSTLRVLLKVTERDGYWWVECGSCEYGWQVPHYAVA